MRGDPFRRSFTHPLPGAPCTLVRATIFLSRRHYRPRGPTRHEAQSLRRLAYVSAETTGNGGRLRTEVDTTRCPGLLSLRSTRSSCDKRLPVLAPEDTLDDRRGRAGATTSEGPSVLSGL